MTKIAEFFEKFSFTILIKWLVLSIVTGVLAGGVGAAFHIVLNFCQKMRIEHDWLICLLPVGGLVIAGAYHLIVGDHDRGTNLILVAVRENKPVRFLLAPLIFCATAITHLLGGSAGREGAALQIGGSLASWLGRILKLNEKDERILVMCGMAAAFASIFGTPVGAVVFSMEVVSVGVFYYGAIVPCAVGAVTGKMLADLCGIVPFYYQIPAADLTVLTSVRVLILAAACAALSIGFWLVMHKTRGLMDKYIGNYYLRAAVGGAVIVILTFAVSSRDYNGAGMDVVARALSGEAVWYAFVLKLIFTAITLGSGYKGGEIVPAFFIGATFGCTAGALLGMDPGFAAAIGMLSVFCGITNCPLASIAIGVELFGSGNVIYICLACAVSYMLSGYHGVYDDQKIMYSKFTAERHL